MIEGARLGLGIHRGGGLVEDQNVGASPHEGP
jgi:hypothetical protein